MGKYRKLSKPEVETYAIIWDDNRQNITGYAEIQTNQSLHSLKTEIDYYTDYHEWKNILSNNGINVDDE
tara:strand:+ start:1834 stop:2040 length:207 start_codon:yes stop_codon:yes gene_type:complete